MMSLRTSHSVGALLLLLVARGAPSAGRRRTGRWPARLEARRAVGRPREPQAEFGRRQATSGAQLLKLLAGDGVAHNKFGVSVSVSSDGARVVVGAGYYYYDDESIQFGSAYVFDGTTGERLLKLVASDGAVFDEFGWLVAVSSDGARVVVGAVGLRRGPRGGGGLPRRRPGHQFRLCVRVRRYHRREAAQACGE
ncbi:unnamed protein product [Prorocentrum cordatum]|uniref:Uncharacterized protein n=1 Tax=Prorocentrum cordatum TaxID=2364126 RepID=A0ABN9WF29_9DINO|nr:unnamed protein product [Polarella glacialis]